MNGGKSASSIEKIIEFVFGRGDVAGERELEKSGAIILALMDFVFRNKDAGERAFDKDFFCACVKNEQFSCAEAVKLAKEQGWLEESAGKITITESGLAYEKEFWKSFR